MRAWTAAGNPDSVRRIVDRWAAVEPGSEAPYREWGFAALAARDRENARAAYRLGREKLRQPDALAGELAQLSTYEGDYPQAITEWLTAVRAHAGLSRLGARHAEPGAGGSPQHRARRARQAR